MAFHILSLLGDELSRRYLCKLYEIEYQVVLPRATCLARLNITFNKLVHILETW